MHVLVLVLQLLLWLGGNVAVQLVQALHACASSCAKRENELRICVVLLEADQLDHMFAHAMQQSVKASASGCGLPSICHMFLDRHVTHADDNMCHST